MANPEIFAPLFGVLNSDKEGIITAEGLQELFDKYQIPHGSVESLKQYIDLVDAEKVKVREAKTLVSVPHPVDLIGTPKEGGAPRRSPEYKGHEYDGELHPLIPLSAHSSVWDLFRHSAARGANRPFLGVRNGDQYVWQNYGEVYERVLKIGFGLVSTCNLEPQSHVGMMLKTCPEWTQSELAMWSQRLVPVTMYETYGWEAMIYIINHSQLSTIISGESTAQKLLSIADKVPTLKTVVIVGSINGLENPHNLKLMEFTELEAAGTEQYNALSAEERANKSGANKDDKLFIIYTSGTTGMPKGVVHRHQSLVANIGAAVSRLDLSEDDVHIAFLPLAHIMEQFLETVFLSIGGSIGYWSGDIRTLMGDVALLKPTTFIAVPRVLKRLYDQIQASFAELEGPKKFLFQQAWQSKKNSLAQGRYRSLWDLIFFQRGAMALGGKVKLIATGSAPISPEVLEFCRIVFSCPVCNGYGMTEVLVTHVTGLSDTRTLSHIGPPIDSVEFKLVDVPEMNYLTSSQPPRGEICLRGQNMVEYHCDPAKTAETIDADGWLHTGDIGELLLPNGELAVIDRIKHLFKLAQGEYVSPETLEQLYLQSSTIAQIFVNGDSLQASLVAIVHPNQGFADKKIRELGLPAETTLEEFCQLSQAKQAVLEDLEKIGKASKVNGYELIKAVHLIPQPFETLGLLTPTFKLKRNESRQHFAEICAQLYASVPQ